ncbi:MAG: glycoside hydrolase family 28 protein [Acidobacteriota bacterium]|nr:glycoside hydrolase family 28 protein [Acidobacteriota bacterium]
MARVQNFAICRRTALSIALAFAPVTAHLSAQDTRTVKEPVIPPACTVLKAALTVTSATSGEIELRASLAGNPDAILDTARLQQAINTCDKGQAVELAATIASTAFLSGPIVLRPGVTLLIDKGVTLYATRNPEYYAFTPGSCGIVNDLSGAGCKPLIMAKSATGSGIMGEGVIDGQGGARIFLDGKISSKSWWDLGEEARDAGQLGGARQQVPRLIDTDLTDDFTLYRITLRNSPYFHVSFHRGDGLTVWGIKIDTPKSARNTDGIDPAQSKNITITHSFIRDGDDNIAIKAGDGPTTHITISHNHFYWGHGMSIGSETNGGVSGVSIDDLSLDGSDNGIRIKSNPTKGGLVEDVLYNDVCIRDSKYPILLDTTYSFPGKGVEQLPVYQGINLHNVRITGGGKIQFNGFDNTHRIAVRLDGVLTLDSPTRYKPQAIHTDITFGPGPVNLIFTGDDSTVGGKETNGNLPGCSAKFVPFPKD